MATQQMHTTEWKRFGPWIDPVTRAEDVPPLYRDTTLDLDAATLVLKVPRDIEHRDAKSDMDLYDHLVVIDEKEVTVLTRHGIARDDDRPRGYDTESIAFADLMAVHDSVNLLRGVVTLHGRDGHAISMRHSGSPRGGVGRLTDHLREQLSSLTPGPWGDAFLSKVDGMEADLSVLRRPGDAGVAGALQDLRADHRDITAWACHAHRRVWPENAGFGQRVQHVLSAAHLQGGVLAGDDTMLELLGRHEWLTRGTVPALSSSRLTIPFARIDGVDEEPHPIYGGAVVLTLRAGGSTMTAVVPEDAPMRRLLTAV
ncbi:hypothetical protein [Demequina zhanjiangensis]|uniref:Uncharacterized protein n=1 Tax=Demequina zhanjiangensis TaxID=3051659 RepID=A0ABT8FY46_9MICO|nr:hypothetical protein [Demequina sp. SYSU T00b26]MDN4471800.1 hypothetical protein [Demequina sp. SYSU T00b26]